MNPHGLRRPALRVLFLAITNLPPLRLHGPGLQYGTEKGHIPLLSRFLNLTARCPALRPAPAHFCKLNAVVVWSSLLSLGLPVPVQATLPRTILGKGMQRPCGHNNSMTTDLQALVQDCGVLVPVVLPVLLFLLCIRGLEVGLAVDPTLPQLGTKTVRAGARTLQSRCRCLLCLRATVALTILRLLPRDRVRRPCSLVIRPVIPWNALGLLKHPCLSLL